MGAHLRARPAAERRAPIASGPMRAIQMTEFGGPEVLRARRAAAAPSPAAGRGADPGHAGRAELRRHPHPHELLRRRRRRCRWCPGGEVAGTREDTGERVVALVGSGGYAEYAVAPRERDLPDPRRGRRRHARSRCVHPGHDRLAPATAPPARLRRGRERRRALRRRRRRLARRRSSGTPFGAGRVIATRLERGEARAGARARRRRGDRRRRRGADRAADRGQRGPRGRRRVRRRPAARCSTPRTRRSRRSGGSSSTGSPPREPERGAHRLAAAPLARGRRLLPVPPPASAPGCSRTRSADLFARAAARRAARDRRRAPTRSSRRRRRRSTCASGARPASCCSTRTAELRAAADDQRTLRRARPVRAHPAGAARRRLRVAEPDPGAGDPAAARRAAT